MTKYFTKEELSQMPGLYETEDVVTEYKQLVAKLFDPLSEWTMYIIETDGNDECFGFVCGTEFEYGYFRLSELASIRRPLGLGIQRDENFEPLLVCEVSL